ncbi:hypothetical protein Mapa_008296 [Marchantia paleacea]|nr:hypothetical protein Mapa_008296 [Marchantia paleacea]
MELDDMETSTTAPPRKRKPRKNKNNQLAVLPLPLEDGVEPPPDGENNMQQITRTKTRAQLSIADKQEICKMHEESPLLSHEDILAQFLLKRKLQIGRSTVTKILKEKEKWLAVDCAGMADEGRRKRARKSPFLGLEAALYAWYSQSVQKQSTTKSMTDSQLRDRAKQLAREAGIEDFKASDGWLANFKKRHSIKLSNVTHEPQDADQAGINRATSVLQKIIDELGFQPQDVFNFGETGLYFRAQPVKTLATIPLRVRKLQKDRITIGFCLNATGEEKLKLVVVYKTKQPRCFAGWNPDTLVHYHHNNHARMTNTVFVDWVRKVNRDMAKQRRRILILLDNAPSHDIPGHEKVRIHTFQTIQLSSVTLLFFPPRTTSAVQPLDAGCIEAFKMHYRKHLLTWSLDDLESGQPGNSGAHARNLASVKDAIIWAVLAWEEVGQQTIQQSWCKVNISPAIWSVDLNNADEREHVRMQTGVEYELGTLISNLNLGELAMNLNQYIMMPGEDQTETSYTDEELLHMIRDVESGTTTADDHLLALTEPGIDVPEDRLPTGVPLDDARRMFRGAAQFMAANPQMFSSEDLLTLQRWCYKVSKATLVDRERQQQSRIMSFFLDE